MEFISYKKDVIKQMEKKKEKALNEVGKYVKKEAKDVVPVDTGYLKSTIDYRKKKSMDEVDIGAGADYAGYVELGTSRQRAQPYLRPSALSNVDKIQKIISESYKE